MILNMDINSDRVQIWARASKETSHLAALQWEAKRSSIVLSKFVSGDIGANVKACHDIGKWSGDSLHEFLRAKCNLYKEDVQKKIIIDKLVC